MIVFSFTDHSGKAVGNQLEEIHGPFFTRPCTVDNRSRLLAAVTKG